MAPARGKLRTIRTVGEDAKPNLGLTDVSEPRKRVWVQYHMGRCILTAVIRREDRFFFLNDCISIPVAIHNGREDRGVLVCA